MPNFDVLGTEGQGLHDAVSADPVAHLSGSPNSEWEQHLHGNGHERAEAIPLQNLPSRTSAEAPLNDTHEDSSMTREEDTPLQTTLDAQTDTHVTAAWHKSKLFLPSGREHSALDQPAYFFARAALGQHIDESLIPHLRKMDKSVQATRQEHLVYGRSNVREDLEKTGNEAYYRKKQAAKLAALFSIASRMKKDFMQVAGNTLTVAGTAYSMMAKAANCGGHASVAAHLYQEQSPEADTNVSLVTMAHKHDDHNWAEVRIANLSQRSDRVVGDSWSDGPAILAEDGAYTSKIENLNELEPWTKQTSEDVNKILASSTSMQSRLEENVKLASLKKIGEMIPGRIWNSGSVYSKSFAENVLLAMRESKTDPEARLAGRLPIDLKNDILASGALRSVGASINESKRAAGSTVSRAKETFTNVLEPRSASEGDGFPEDFWSEAASSNYRAHQPSVDAGSVQNGRPSRGRSLSR